jgi:hypothetical protein
MYSQYSSGHETLELTKDVNGNGKFPLLAGVSFFTYTI